MTRFHSTLSSLSALLCLASIACSDGGATQGRVSGAGGDPGASGGFAAGTGGFAAGTGGFAAGTGGFAAGTGGFAAGTGGFAAGTGGATGGTGGVTTGDDIPTFDAPEASCELVNGTIPNRICIKGKSYYLNGINVAWDQWTADLTHYDSDQFRALYQELQAAGGNAVRWWWFIDGSQQITFDGQLAQPLSQAIFDNLDQAFDDAADFDILIMPVLLSFDIESEGNQFLVTNQAATEAFIDHVVTPLVTRYNDHEALGLWEIMNEGDWLLSSEGGPVSVADYQRFHGLVAAGIHAADSDALVTTGSASYKYLAQNQLMTDAALMAAAGGNPLAHLDVYQTHYYDWMHGTGWTYEPWVKTASEWMPGSSKAILLGEFACKGEPGRWSAMDMHVETVKQGYAGSFCWAYFDNRIDKEGKWSDAKPGVRSIGASIPEAIAGE